MNLRLSIMLVAVLVIFGGTFLVVRFTGPKERVPDEPWLFKIDDGAITHIAATHKDQTVNYDKKPGSSKWYIQEDPEVPVFLDKWSGTTLLVSGPRVNRVLADNIDDPAAYGLDPPETKIQVTDRNGNGFEFHLGIPTPDDKNQYARLVGSPKLFTVPAIWAQVITQLATEPPYPRLYGIEEENMLQILVSHEGRIVDYRNNRVTKEWSIQGDPVVPVFAPKWYETLDLIVYPRVSQVLSETIEDLASYGLDPANTTVMLIQLDGSTVEFHLGTTTPDGQSYYARRAGQPELMIIPASWAQAINELATDPPYPPDEAATPSQG